MDRNEWASVARGDVCAHVSLRASLSLRSCFVLFFSQSIPWTEHSSFEKKRVIFPQFLLEIMIYLRRVRCLLVFWYVGCPSGDCRLSVGVKEIETHYALGNEPLEELTCEILDDGLQKYVLNHFLNPYYKNLNHECI